ncbi:MAG: lysylphosphatidylglycerol synthase transmembrane domain-containing protein, partial [Candidatus Syntropharchaeales archaeon]
MRAKKRLLQIVLGIVIIAFILYKLGPEAVYETLKHVDLAYFILAGCAYLAYNTAMAIRLKYLMKVISKENLPFKDIFFSHMGGMIASDVTPARSGYFLTPVFLKKKGENLTITAGMAAILAPQGIEFILKVVGSLLGIFLLISSVANTIITPLLFAGVIFMLLGSIILVFLWTSEESSLKIISKIPFMKRFVDEFSRLKEESIKIRPEIPFILLLHMTGWVLITLQWALLGRSLGIDLGYIAYFLLHPLLSLLAFVPITPAGFGLMEGGTTG